MGKRTMAGLSGSVIELSNYLEQRISQKSAEYAAVRLYFWMTFFDILLALVTSPNVFNLTNLHVFPLPFLIGCVAVSILAVCCLIRRGRQGRLGR